MLGDVSKFLGQRVLRPKVRRFLRDWGVPPGYIRLWDHMTFRMSSRLTPEEAALLSRNARFKNMYAGRRCFVIGNGPSLNKQDLAPLADEVTIVMNRFNKHPILDKWKPTFFCMAEPAETLKAVGLALFLHNIDATSYFFRTEVKEILDEQKLLDAEKVNYLKMTGAPLDGRPACTRSLDLTRTVPGAQNTAHMAIMIALYLGCSPIYLLGMDHDWLAKEDRGYRHFYGDSDELGGISYRRLLESGLIVWRIYESLQDIAHEQGAAIHNATAGGFLDVFPRVQFEALFPEIGK